MEKKAFTWLEWTLAMGIVVSITAIVIVWSTRQTETLTQETVISVTGRSDCKEIKLSAVLDCPANTITITNRGHLKIRKLLFTLDGSNQMDSEKEGYPELNIQGTGAETISLNTFQPFSNVTILPIIEVEGQLFGCQDKRLVERCS